MLLFLPCTITGLKLIVDKYPGMPVTDNHFRGKSKYGIKGALIMFLEVKSTLINLK